MGTELSPTVLEQTGALFKPMHPPFNRALADDIEYAADPRQRLDIYSADSLDRPVILYVPGGGFVGGDKDDGEVFYRNIGKFFAEAGYVCVIMNYRLAPSHPWPAGGSDVIAALAWCRNNISAYGGDSGRIFLCGQSAGATHAATALFQMAPQERAALRGVMLINGLFDTPDTPDTPNFDAYFGPRSTRAARSPLELCQPIDVPVLLALTEHEPRFLASSTFRLADRLCVLNGAAPQVDWLAGHNHVSCVFAIGTSADDLGLRLLAFCAAHGGVTTSPIQGV
jgi:acetyl esterase/lipase